MCNEKFEPVIRFAVMSDIHIKDDHTVERDRMVKGINDAYKIAENHETYKSLDALVLVGDFANSGTETQFLAVKKICDDNLKEGKELIASVASHEYNKDSGAMEAAWEKLRRIFGCEPDVHKVIKGFHFVSTSPSRGCNFNEEKQKFAYENLKSAAEDDPKKPIFTFQHPHMTGTVYGSILWGEDDLYAAYLNFPQIIDFSGHSHAPINDPRSIHQEHFTCLGTGTLSYFELDEFDKDGGTIPENKAEAAQMLIVEADKDNRVRVYPYDILTGNFFPFVWKIDVPSDPETFIYTDQKRYSEAQKPYFKDDAKAEAKEITDCGAVIEFPQAVADDMPYVNNYDIILRRKADGIIVSQKSVWSDYYLYNMPKTKCVKFDGLKADTEYTAKITAEGFFKNPSTNFLTVEFKTL